MSPPEKWECAGPTPIECRVTSKPARSCLLGGRVPVCFSGVHICCVTKMPRADIQRQNSVVPWLEDVGSGVGRQRSLEREGMQHCWGNGPLEPSSGHFPAARGFPGEGAGWTICRASSHPSSLNCTICVQSPIAYSNSLNMVNQGLSGHWSQPSEVTSKLSLLHVGSTQEGTNMPHGGGL